MKNYNAKLTINKTQNDTEIVVSAQIVKNKFTLLLVWLVLWSLCGMIVFSQFFVTHSKEIKLFMFIWFIFWIYFEYKVAYAYMWRKYGKEIIKLNKQGISIKKDINGNGKEKFFAKDAVKDLKMVDFSGKNIVLHMNTSFWVVGGETLRFDFNGKIISFGMQLTEAEATEVYKQVKFGLR